MATKRRWQQREDDNQAGEADNQERMATKRGWQPREDGNQERMATKLERMTTKRGWQPREDGNQAGEDNNQDNLGPIIVVLCLR